MGGLQPGRRVKGSKGVSIGGDGGAASAAGQRRLPQTPAASKCHLLPLIWTTIILLRSACSAQVQVGRPTSTPPPLCLPALCTRGLHQTPPLPSRRQAGSSSPERAPGTAAHLAAGLVTAGAGGGPGAWGPLARLLLLPPAARVGPVPAAGVEPGLVAALPPAPPPAHPRGCGGGLRDGSSPTCLP